MPTYVDADQYIPADLNADCSAGLAEAMELAQTTRQKLRLPQRPCYLDSQWVIPINGNTPAYMDKREISIEGNGCELRPRGIEGPAVHIDPLCTPKYASQHPGVQNARIMIDDLHFEMSAAPLAQALVVGERGYVVSSKSICRIGNLSVQNASVDYPVELINAQKIALPELNIQGGGLLIVSHGSTIKGFAGEIFAPYAQVYGSYLPAVKLSAEGWSSIEGIHLYGLGTYESGVLIEAFGQSAVRHVDLRSYYPDTIYGAPLSLKAYGNAYIDRVCADGMDSTALSDRLMDVQGDVRAVSARNVSIHPVPTGELVSFSPSYYRRRDYGAYSRVDIEV